MRLQVDAQTAQQQASHQSARSRTTPVNFDKKQEFQVRAGDRPCNIEVNLYYVLFLFFCYVFFVSYPEHSFALAKQIIERTSIITLLDASFVREIDKRSSFSQENYKLNVPGIFPEINDPFVLFFLQIIDFVRFSKERDRSGSLPRYWEDTGLQDERVVKYLSYLTSDMSGK